MKIAIFTDIFLPHVDGVTNSLVHLIEEYIRTGHKVLVVTPKTKGCEKVKIPGVEILFLPSVPARIYPEFMFGFFSSKLMFSLKRFAPEIVHITAPGPVGSMGIFYSRLVKIKAVATFHGYFMEPEYLRVVGIKNRGVKLAQRILWKYAKTFYDRADSVITPSAFVKKDLELHDFVRPITVINNAVNFSSIKKDPREHANFVKKYNLKNKKIMLYIGRISVEKNIEFLITNFASIVKQVSDAHLLIVGNGPDKKRLEALVSQLKLQEKVTFTGEIKNTDLVTKDVFSVAQIFATASHSEVQPMSIIEAMQFGLPIIAVKSRGLTEMIQGNGILILEGNKEAYVSAAVKILSSSKLQSEFSTKSKSLAKEYSLENSAKKHIALYTNLIKNIEDKHFLKRVFKSRLLASYKDIIFLLGIIHTIVLTYLFFVKNQPEYLNILYILDIEKIFPNIQPTTELFFLSAIFFIATYLFFFYRNREK